MPEELERERVGWRRLGLEGFVIVVSILLAFAVDAAWDGHLDRRRLGSSLDQLREQLSGNREEISRAIDRNLVTMSRLRLFLLSSPEELRTMPVDSLQSISGAFQGHGIYDQDGGVAEAFVAEGLLDLVRDPDLRHMLMVWGTLPDELEEDYAAIPAADEGLRTFLVDHAVLSAREGIPGADGLDRALFDMRSDPRAVEAVLHRLIAIASYNRNLEAFRADLFEPLSTQLEQRQPRHPGPAP